MRNGKADCVLRADGRTGVEWANSEKPCLNYWYRTMTKENDFWKITKDFHSPETGITYYKIVEYYNGDILYAGRTLRAIREIMRDNTYRMVI